MSAWTRFFDMSSGGRNKFPPDTIWIEAGENEAVKAFEEMLGRNPHNVTCDCCGSDYSVYESSFDAGAADWVITAADLSNFRATGAMPAFWPEVSA